MSRIGGPWWEYELWPRRKTMARGSLQWGDGRIFALSVDHPALAPRRIMDLQPKAPACEGRIPPLYSRSGRTASGSKAKLFAMQRNLNPWRRRRRSVIGRHAAAQN